MNTILIVDDVPINIDVLTEILRDSYSIMAASSGESTIKLLSRRKPDLVLLDLSMPDIDGFDVLRYMKDSKELSGIPVIFVTGEHDVEAEEKGIRLGAVDYIKKPYNEAIVKAKVRNHLELKSYRDNLEVLISERTKELEERKLELEAYSKQLEKRTKQLAASREAIIMGMSLMSEIHDSVTGEHIERIKIYTKILADKMLEMYPDLITPDLAEQIVLFSPLHDIGKVGIPDNILKKAEKLTPEEFELMKSHTISAGEILKKTEEYLIDDDVNLRVAREIAVCHHEKYDGTGYPYGYKGEQIPLSARITTAADIYDALRSDRPYKKGYTHEESVDIILSGDGRTMPEHFDPKVLEVFSAVQDDFNINYSSAGRISRKP